MYLLDSGSIVEDSVGTPECEGHLRGPDSGGGHHPPGHAGGCSECHCVGCGGGLLVCNEHGILSSITSEKLTFNSHSISEERNGQNGDYSAKLVRAASMLRSWLF